jgi:hypothetical protein
MFPETFAEHWIRKLTAPGDVILDPFSGRGTTALSAILAGRRSVACDVNEVAYCLTKAKTNAPTLRTVQNRISELHRGFRASPWREKAHELPEFFKMAFSQNTLAQLLYLRQSLRWKSQRSDCLIAALAVGALHGDLSSSYFSNQMPRTISTKPAYSVRFWKAHGLFPPERDVFAILQNRASYRYVSPVPRGESLVLHRDMRALPGYLASSELRVSCVVTSPPYLDVTSFEEDQWLRLWFLGGLPFPSSGRLSRDDRHSSASNYWNFIADMWRCLGSVVVGGGHVVIRLGTRTTRPENMKRCLVSCARLSARSIRLVSSTVTQIKRRQTDSFRPGSKGCAVEVDCHFRFND